VEEHEEYEQIPWAQLTGGPPGGKRRVVYMVAAALGTLVLAILVGRAFLSSSSETVAPAQTPAGVADEGAVGEGPPTSAADITSPSALLYREADLMAFTGSVGERAAVARAEWFVTDYFTADLEPSGSADVRTALPAGAEVPGMPQDATASLSYVEWARAFRVEELGDGLFRVGVVFRTLGAPPDRGFYRLPVRAVEVLVQVNEDGGSVVADLPAPVALPAGPEPEAWPEESADPPRSVADAALAMVAGWGTEPRLVSAAPGEDGWRVVLTLADEVGNRWPASVFVAVEDASSSGG
jgi:hypothetical protein